MSQSVRQHARAFDYWSSLITRLFNARALTSLLSHDATSRTIVSTRDTAAANNIYSEVQLQIEEDLKRRAEENQARVDEIKQQRRKRAGGPTPLIIVADGDSWFDYPLPLVGHTDVADSLKSQATLTPAMMKLAHYGDATTTLMGVTKRRRLIDYIGDPAHGPIDVIMFSGGGNDLVGDQFRFWLENAADVNGDPTRGVNGELLGDILGVINSAYLELIRIRNRYSRNATILLHAYDFAIPTGIGACPFAGPWLRPSLVEQGWPDVEQGRLIVKIILEALRSRLNDLCATEKNVVLVDTQGTLSSSEWANELHPTPLDSAKLQPGSARRCRTSPNSRTESDASLNGATPSRAMPHHFLSCLACGLIDCGQSCSGQ